MQVESQGKGLIRDSQTFVWEQEWMLWCLFNERDFLTKVHYFVMMMTFLPRDSFKDRQRPSPWSRSNSIDVKVGDSQDLRAKDWGQPVTVVAWILSFVAWGGWRSGLITLPSNERRVGRGGCNGRNHGWHGSSPQVWGSSIVMKRFRRRTSEVIVFHRTWWLSDGIKVTRLVHSLQRFSNPVSQTKFPSISIVLVSSGIHSVQTMMETMIKE